MPGPESFNRERGERRVIPLEVLLGQAADVPNGAREGGKEEPPPRELEPYLDDPAMREGINRARELLQRTSEEHPGARPFLEGMTATGGYVALVQQGAERHDAPYWAVTASRGELQDPEFRPPLSPTQSEVSGRDGKTRIPTEFGLVEDDGEFVTVLQDGRWVPVYLLPSELQTVEQRAQQARVEIARATDPHAGGPEAHRGGLRRFFRGRRS